MYLLKSNTCLSQQQNIGQYFCHDSVNYSTGEKEGGFEGTSNMSLG
jgi:hypothetical protein